MMQLRSLQRNNVKVLVGMFAVLALAALVTFYVRYAHDRDEVDAAATELLADNAATPYTTLDGELFSFVPYRGKVRVVTMWASWSPYTQRELPILSQIASTYEAKGVVAIALNRKEPQERAKAYLSTLEEQLKLVYVIDETDAFYLSVGGYAMPETVIFDADGNIAWHHRGEISYELVQTEVEKLISN